MSSPLPSPSRFRAMAEELANGGEQAWSRMSGYPSGRSILTECMVERFSRSPREWEEAFKSRDNRAKMLAEILAVESKTKPGKEEKARGKDDSSRSSTAGGARPAGKLAPSPFNKQMTSGGGGGEEGAKEDAGGKGKEKRRRQRGRGKRGKSSAGGAGDGGGGEGEGDAASGAGDRANVADPVSEAKGEKIAGEPPTSPGRGNAGTHKGVGAESVAGHEVKAKREKSYVEGGGAGEDATLVSQEKKKKKRKRQDSGVGSAGAELDLLDIGNSAKEAAPAEEQAAETSNKVKTKTKGKKGRLVAESRHGDRQKYDVFLGSGAATSDEAKKVRTGKKKKKDNKRHGATSEEATVAKSPSPSRSCAKKKGADGDVPVVAEAAASPGKKRKKASSSGFRLF